MLGKDYCTVFNVFNIQPMQANIVQQQNTFQSTYSYMTQTSKIFVSMAFRGWHTVQAVNFLWSQREFQQ